MTTQTRDEPMLAIVVDDECPTCGQPMEETVEHVQRTWLFCTACQVGYWEDPETGMIGATYTPRRLRPPPSGPQRSFWGKVKRILVVSLPITPEERAAQKLARKRRRALIRHWIGIGLVVLLAVVALGFVGYVYLQSDEPGKLQPGDTPTLPAPTPPTTVLPAP